MITRDQANARAREITVLLNDKIDKANSDPRLKSPYREVPIGRHPLWEGPWEAPQHGDDFETKNYRWGAAYELGVSKSSDCLTVYYFPNPARYIDQEGFASEKLLRVNPNADLSQELYAVLYADPEFEVVSPDFHDVLGKLDQVIESIAESRTK